MRVRRRVRGDAACAGKGGRRDGLEGLGEGVIIIIMIIAAMAAGVAVRVGG